jgi:hypothetical protein
MNTYTTFGGEDIPLTAESARLRAEYADANLGPLVTKAVAAVNMQSELNEVKLGRIYKPVIKGIQASVGANAGAVNTLVNQSVAAIQNRIATHMAGVNNVMGKLPTSSFASPNPSVGTGTTGGGAGGGSGIDRQCPPNTTLVNNPDGTYSCVPNTPLPPVPIPAPLPTPIPTPDPNANNNGTGVASCPPFTHMEFDSQGNMICVPNTTSCPVGTHPVYNTLTGTFDCIADPPPPPACTDPTQCLGCGPTIGSCDGTALAIAGQPTDPTALAAKHANTPTEVWAGSAVNADGTPTKVGIFIGAVPPQHEYATRISGPAPLSLITLAVPKLTGTGTKITTTVTADTTPPLPGTVCPAGGPCPAANCPDGFHWEQQLSDGTWKCVPTPPAGSSCQNLLPATLRPWDVTKENLCETLQAYTDLFAAAGEQFLNIAVDTLDDVTVILKIAQLTTQIPVIGGMITAILTPSTNIGKLLNDVACTLRGLKNIAWSQNANTIAGLWFAKSIIRSAESVRLGWDLGIWITADFHLEFPQLIDILDQLISYAQPNEIPNQGEVLQLWVSNMITSDQAKCLLQMQGIAPYWADKLKGLETEKLTPDMIVRLSWRRSLRDYDVDTNLNRVGFNDVNDINDFKDVMREIPPPSEVIHWVVREVFNPQKLGLAEMTNELTQELNYRQFANAAGIGTITLPDNTGKLVQHDLPLYYWLAHYQEISPTQGYEMLHRLRPGREEHFAAFMTGDVRDQLTVILPGVTATYDPNTDRTKIVPPAMDSLILARLLKQNEYNPIWRSRLEAISYNVLTRVDIRRMYAKNTFGDPRGIDGFAADSDGNMVPEGPAEIEITERYQDQGYTREDSILLAYFTASLWVDTTQKLDKRWIADICKSYTIGAVSYDDAKQELTNAYHGDDVTAQKYLDLCDFEMTIRDVALAIKAIKSAFLRGEYSEQDARNQMSSTGLSNKRQDINMRQWKLEMAAAGKQASAAGMCQWYGEGSISVDEMFTRLTRQNWSAADATRFVNHCQVGILAKTTAERDKVAAKLAAEQRRLQSAEQKAQAKLEKLQKDALASFLSAFTDKHITDWWKDHLIDRQTVRNALTLKRWAPQQIDEYIAEYLK